MNFKKFNNFFTYSVLSLWSLAVLFPIWTLIVNSFKPQKEIFKNPFGLPSTFTFEGYKAAWSTGRFDLYFINTLIVTFISLFLILLIGSLAAYTLAKWKSPVSKFLYVFFHCGPDDPNSPRHTGPSPPYKGLESAGHVLGASSPSMWRWACLLPLLCRPPSSRNCLARCLKRRG